VQEPWDRRGQVPLGPSAGGLTILVCNKSPRTTQPSIEYWPVWLGLRPGAFTCVGWQVTVCDPIWQVTLIGYVPLTAIQYLYWTKTSSWTWSNIYHCAECSKQWSFWEQRKEWNLVSGCGQAKLMLRHYNASQVTYASRLPGREFRKLVGLLTGHADLNWHLALINVKSDALCPLCQEQEESPLRFLGKCSATVRIRFKQLGSYQQPSR